MVDILHTGVSGLMAFQRSLATTGHNIANANTSNYSRQRVDLVSNSPWNEGGNNAARSTFIGTGVNVAGVSRIYDDFLTQQVRGHDTSVNQLETLDELITQASGLLGDSKTGLAPALRQFFAALQDVADTPDSLAVRQTLLSQGESLAARFREVDNQLNKLRDDVNQGLRGAVTQINTLADAVAAANQEIIRVQGSAGTAPSDLLDHRDKLLAELAQQIAVQTVPQENGAITVFIGNGQTLVLGNEAKHLEVVSSAVDPQSVDIRYQGQKTDLSEQLTGGQVGGYLSFRSQVLDQTQDTLGLLAMGLAGTFNAQHRQGIDLNGNPGGVFFQTGVPQILPNSRNTGTISLAVTVNDVGRLQRSNYEMRYDGANYSVWRLADDTMVASGATGPFAVDGLSITVSGGTLAAGDSFLIQPTRQGATDFAVAIADPAAIAAAMPTGDVGDNRNALALSALQSSQTLLNGTASYQGVYAQLVAEVGAQGNRTQNTLESQKALLEQSIQARDAVSGVNLDEEAADLLRFQQAYEAAAQVIRVADSLFTTLLGAIRR
jgi:flagellar hook-associated protein 1 FlgK